MNTLVLTILLIVLVALIIAVVRWSFRTIPEATAGVVERSGRYHRTLKAGPHIVIPVVDRVRVLIDLREQMLNLRPHQVLTSDQVKVTIEAVVYFRVTDPKAATYEVADYTSAFKELTTTTLRAVAAGMDMAQITEPLQQCADDRAWRCGARMGSAGQPGGAQGPRAAVRDSGGHRKPETRRA